MVDPKRFILRQLAFTGSTKATRELPFVDGVNVVWGASNAGKSLTVKALDYMFGASATLPDARQSQGYETCWLELDLPASGRTTLARSLTGGGFNLYQGSFDDAQHGTPFRALAASHSKKTESLSSFLLAELGVFNKEIVANIKTGDKHSLTFRHFASYVFTEETPMMAESSPIKIAAQSSETFDKNVLKFILTGIDGSGVVTTKSVSDQRAANAGKIEIVDELIAAAAADLKRLFPDEEDTAALDLEAQDAALSLMIDEQQATLIECQSELDRLRLERRGALIDREELTDRAAEIAETLERFALLANVYDSDIGRLESLEEGAAALMAGARRLCPLCGAEPEHQHEVHGLDHIERSQRAVRAEIAKIRSERTDLVRTMASLKAEQEGLLVRSERQSALISTLERQIDVARPLEVNSRNAYEQYDRARQRLREGLALKKRIAHLAVRKTELAAFRPTSRQRDSIAVGVGGVIGYEFASTVQSILHAWQFPGTPVVSFNDKNHDIQLDGSDRRANGKGVRALMNAAFKIGVLIYCRAKGLPHPGIVVLDSPLVSYRDPHTSKHGDLSPDERAITNAGLNHYFYQYLLDNARGTQFVIIENDAPPVDLGPAAMVTRFVGSGGQGGRLGLL